MKTSFRQALSNNRYYVLLAIFINSILFYAIYKHKVVVDVEYVEKDFSHSLVSSLNFFNRDAKYCEDLMGDWSVYKMSSSYDELVTSLNQEQLKVSSKDGEGFSAQLLPEKVVLHHIARQASVKTICETGFNYGHSSFNFLSANTKANIFSFDLGSHAYVSKMNESLHRFFPGTRLHLTIGDSTATIPIAVSEGRLPLCDIAFVDGGHVYPVAKSDIANFATHMSPDNLILFDDYPTNWGKGFGKAWEESLSGGKLKKGEEVDFEGIRNTLKSKMVDRSADRLVQLNSKFAIKELLRCSMRENDGLERGMVVGTVVMI